MKPVIAHKALSQPLFLYGFSSLDFFVVIICPLLIAITVSYLLGALCLVGFWVAGKKLKHRPGRYFSSLFLFCVTPGILGVRPDADIPHYADKSNIA